MSRRSPQILQRNWKTIFAALTMIVDAASVAIALAIGYAVNFSRAPFETFLARQWKLVIYSIGLYLFLGAVFGVYRQSYSSLARVQFTAFAKSYVLGTLVIFATLFLYKNTYYAQGALLTYIIIFPVVYLFVRFIWWLLRKSLHRRAIGHERTAVLLLDPEGEKQVTSLKAYPLSGYDVVGIQNIGASRGNDLDDFLASIKRIGARCIFLAGSSLERLGSLDLLDALASDGFNVRMLTPEIHSILSRTRLYDHAGIAYAVPPSPLLKALHQMLKRVFDLMLASLLLALASPVIIVLSVAIRLESSGGVFFRQVRALSRDSSRILLYKFRSMASNAEEIRETLVDENGEGDVLFKLRDDPRRTWVGKFIRKFSLDEIPQLFNVMTGEMTLVGPRPLPINDFNKLAPNEVTSELYSRRSLAKPGITGLWQISGRSGLSFRDMVILDLYYAENQTLLFDIEILAKTVPVVLFGKGAY